VHADHITSAFELRKLTGAKTAISHLACVECVDLLLEDGQELKLGNKTVKAITTPGHTNSCMSYYFEGRVFSGDTLLIRGCGRTDFQQGSSEKLYHSVHQKLFNLPDDTIVFPGHDYRGFTSSTIALEKKFNPRLALKNSLEDFKKMSTGGEFMIKRLIEQEVLTTEVIDKMYGWAKSKLGIHYDNKVNLNNDELYNAEFVWKIYKSCLGLPLSEPKELKEYKIEDE
jgi:glyoxylase-like metal-dependent hydrolase (beta-lactamase superfamily II)